MSNESEQITLAVNHVLNERRLRAARTNLAYGGSSDTKRPKSWCEYGFPDEVTTGMLYRMWRRGGVAFGAVAKIVGNCWKTKPEVIEGGEEDNNRSETAFDKQFSTLAKSLRLWSIFREADTRRLVGKYSVLILRYADGLALNQPLNGRSTKLVEIVPVWSGACEVKQYERDTFSANYGKPLMWTYKERATMDGGGRDVDIHPDRVFVLGDYSRDATAFLEPAYNALISLEKVEGGSGESFLKNASRQLNINFDKEVKPETIATMYGVSDMTKFRAALDDAARSINQGVDSMMATSGATVTPLVSTVPDPSPTYEVNLNTIAAALDIPVKILVGQQSGDRASTEDREYFNDRCQSRRLDLSQEITDFIQQIAAAGVIAIPAETTVVWDNLNESSGGDKAELAKKLSDMNAQAVQPGEEPFTKNEIRVAAGYMPMVTPDVLGE